MNYKTRQREAIYTYIKNINRDVTAAEIKEHFKANGVAVSLTTIYRHLDKLEKDGILRKYKLDGSTSACYKSADPDNKFLLKCENCGELVRFKCHDLDHLYKHFNSDHNFAINPYKTVFYGRCDRCKW